MVHKKLRMLVILLAVIFVWQSIPFGYSTDAPNLVWEKTFGGTGDDYSWSVQVAGDGGYIIAAVTESFGLVGLMFTL